MSHEKCRKIRVAIWLLLFLIGSGDVMRRIGLIGLFLNIVYDRDYVSPAPYWSEADSVIQFLYSDCLFTVLISPSLQYFVSFPFLLFIHRLCLSFLYFRFHNRFGLCKIGKSVSCKFAHSIYVILPTFQSFVSHLLGFGHSRQNILNGCCLVECAVEGPLT